MQNTSTNSSRRRLGAVSLAFLAAFGIAGLSACADTPSAGKNAVDAKASGAPAILGIHHLKFLVADIDKSTAFYETAFGAKRLVAMDHRRPDGVLFGAILDFPSIGTELELRLDPVRVNEQKGLDPITLAVGGLADLEKWSAHFEAKGLRHSPVLTGLVGWLVVIEDPDGRRIRLYTRQTHGPELKVDWISPWIN